MFGELLGNAPIPASSDSNVELVLISAGVVLGVAILAFIPIRLARSRGRRNQDALLAIAIVWGLLLASSISYSVMKLMDWNATFNQRLDSGYANPDDQSDKPHLPVALWVASAAAYAGMIIWAGRPAGKS